MGKGSYQVITGKDTGKVRSPDPKIKLGNFLTKYVHALESCHSHEVALMMNVPCLYRSLQCRHLADLFIEFLLQLGDLLIAVLQLAFLTFDLDVKVIDALL